MTISTTRFSNVEIGLDTNVLVYAHIPAMPDHEHVRRYLLAQLADDARLVVIPLVLHELVHVLTDSRRFDPPISDIRGRRCFESRPIARMRWASWVSSPAWRCNSSKLSAREAGMFGEHDVALRGQGSSDR